MSDLNQSVRLNSYVGYNKTNFLVDSLTVIEEASRIGLIEKVHIWKFVLVGGVRSAIPTYRVLPHSLINVMNKSQEMTV